MKKRFIIVLGCWLAAVCVNYFCRVAHPLEIKEEIRFVPQQAVVDILSFDHRGLAADVLFIQTMLHSGSLMWKPFKYTFDSEWSYQIMDLVTTLDPQYLTAYLFSGMGLVHGPKDVLLARPILERGMTHYPENWELPFWLGYHCYIYLEDYETAGKYFWRAAHLPNAPKSYMSLLFSSLKKGGEYEKAILALKGMIKHTQNRKIAKIYHNRIVHLENMVALQNALKKFKAIKGHPPENLNELVAEKLMDTIPKDSAGKDYLWDKQTLGVKIAN